MAIFQRKLCGDLLEWKETSAGSTTLLVEGAWRVGKSTIAEAFARGEYRSHMLIDFSQAPKVVRDLFDDISDLDHLFMQLQFLTGVQLYPRESLIVCDEVQLCPRAR